MVLLLHFQERARQYVLSTGRQGAQVDAIVQAMGEEAEQTDVTLTLHGTYLRALARVRHEARRAPPRRQPRPADPWDLHWEVEWLAW